LAFGGPPIFDGINLQIEAGDRLCLMGRNGSGKSTLLKLIGGELTPEGGEVQRQQGLKVAQLTQDVPQGLTGNVFDVVASGMGTAAAVLAEYHHVSHQMAHDHSEKLLARLEVLQKELEENDGWNLHQEVERVLNRLDLDAETEFTELSGVPSAVCCWPVPSYPAPTS